MRQDGVMDIEPNTAIAACVAAHQRLRETTDTIDDETVRAPSRLPGWSVGHVLTHLARNADGHVLRLEGALGGREVARYPGGGEQRERDIEQGARRTARELVEDLAGSARRLEDTWSRSQRAGWPNSHLLADDHWPTSASSVRRLREVEVHHVDLGLGFEPTDWSDDFVDWELPLTLKRLPRRLSQPADARGLLAWLIGRSESAAGVHLDPW